MIQERNDFDLTLLAGHFTECGDYTKDVILAELQWEQKNGKDFLVLIYGDIDGFLIAHRHRNSLWIAQVWHRNDKDLLTGKEAIVLAKDWAGKRGMTSITFETKRNETKAAKRYGFVPFSTIMRMEL